jgi:hypothetical protein
MRLPSRQRKSAFAVANGNMVATTTTMQLNFTFSRSILFVLFSSIQRRAAPT